MGSFEDLITLALTNEAELEAALGQTCLQVRLEGPLLVSLNRHELFQLLFGFEKVRGQLVFVLLKVDKAQQCPCYYRQDTVKTSDITEQHEGIVDGAFNLNNVPVHSPIDGDLLVKIIPLRVDCASFDYEGFVLCFSLPCDPQYEIIIMLDLSLTDLPDDLALTAGQGVPCQY